MTNPTKPLSQRVALITGASRGLGRAAAVALAQAGAHVILLARTQGGLEETDDLVQSVGGTATLLPFDLTHTDKIEAIAPVIAERFKRLDILVANAATLGALSPVAHSDPKVFENAFRINFLANYYLVRTLDPFLRGSDAGRAVFISSGAAREAAAYWGGYAAAKSALESLARTYAAETAHSRLKVNIFDPGILRSKLRAEAYPGEDPATLPTPEAVAARLVELCSPHLDKTGMTFEAAA